MTEQPSRANNHRRRREPQWVSCTRETCPGLIKRTAYEHGRKYCSVLCGAVDDALRKAQAYNAAPEQWAALVAVADSISEWRRTTSHHR